MEARFERDELERELKRVQRDNQALELLRGIDDGREAEEDAGDLLLAELLRSSDQEMNETARTRWDLPLPVPPELETEDRMEEILQICEEALGGLKLQAIKRSTLGNKNNWSLTGSAGPLEFTVEFQTLIEGERTIVRNFELKRIPQECVQEIMSLMELARARSCVRTWLIGMSEYSFLVKEREACFAEIRRTAPYGSCRPAEKRVQAHLEAASGDNERVLRLVWRAEWTVLPSISEPNEFLLPKCELVAVKGFDEATKSLLEDPDTLAGMARKNGLANAVVSIIRKMYE